MGNKNKLDKVLDILNKFEFFYGQRAGRELWADKPVEVQNQDIINFINDIKYIKNFLNESVILSKTDYERLKQLSEINTDFKQLRTSVEEALSINSSDIAQVEKYTRKATVEKCIQLLEEMKVPEDGRHEWRDRHNDTLDRCKARFTKEFKIKG